MSLGFDGLSVERNLMPSRELGKLACRDLVLGMRQTICVLEYRFFSGATN